MEERWGKGFHKKTKNIIFSPSCNFIISVIEYEEKKNNIYIFTLDNSKWRLLVSFKQESKTLDVFFNSDNTFQCKENI